MAEEYGEGGSDPVQEGEGSSGGNWHSSVGGAHVIIFGLLLTLFEPNACIAIPPVSALTSLCRLTTKPPFLHASACLIEKLAPQPSQRRGRSTNPNQYLLRIPSLHSSFDRDSSLTSVSWTEI